jgi:hypothetical protein
MASSLLHGSMPIRAMGILANIFMIIIPLNCYFVMLALVMLREWSSKKVA